tara:strand:- start:70 stop:636 length:567 start_codon:yes stop_codon:yes gene_type:complete
MLKKGAFTYSAKSEDGVKSEYNELRAPDFKSIEDLEINKSVLKDLKIGIVVADWNGEITEALLDSAVMTLSSLNVDDKNITVMHVPGSFELLHGAKLLRENSKPDVIICIGCLIEGETEHFNIISNAVSSGIRDLNLQSDTPVVFGVLTTKTFQQAKDRTTGEHSDAGVDFAKTAVTMGYLRKEAASK